MKIREEMARESDYDTDLFAEAVRSDKKPPKRSVHSLADDVPETGRRRKRAE